MSYIANLYAERIGGNKFGKETEIFKFEKIKMEKRQADIDNPTINLIDIGVDYISSGALTHSAPIMDLSLKNLHAC